MSRIILYLSCLLLACPAFGQGDPDVEPTGLNTIYRKEKHGGFSIQSHGFGGFYRNETHMTAKLRRAWELELVTLKHPKEYRTQTPDNSTRGYVFGKLNSIFIARGGFGFQRRLHGKDVGRGVEVRGHFFAGPSIAFAKPVYLRVVDNTTEHQKVEKYDPDEHQFHEILGKGPVLKGLGETRPYPGAYVKAGLAFEYSGSFDAVKGIETGIIADTYFRPLPVLAFAKNPPVWISLYLSVFFGKKYL